MLFRSEAITSTSGTIWAAPGPWSPSAGRSNGPWTTVRTGRASAPTGRRPPRLRLGSSSSGRRSSRPTTPNSTTSAPAATTRRYPGGPASIRWRESIPASRLMPIVQGILSILLTLKEPTGTHTLKRTVNYVINMKTELFQKKK